MKSRSHHYEKKSSLRIIDRRFSAFQHSSAEPRIAGGCVETRPDPIALLSALHQFVNGKDTLRYYRETIKGTGQPQYKKIYEELKNCDVSKQLEFEANACFAAGTLVHTQEGLKPIEQIKVGDMVLSKHESGEGERAYKRVTKTFVHEDAQLVTFGYGGWDAAGKAVWGERFLVTPNHPIWVVKKGWKEVGTMRSTYPRPTLLAALQGEKDGTQVRATSTEKLYFTRRADIAFRESSYSGHRAAGMGGLYDVLNNKQVLVEGDPTTAQGGYWSQFGGDGSVIPCLKPRKEQLYRARVYNIEVEDFHTYYVGQHGLWVHNKNLKIDTQYGGVGLSPKINIERVFHTRAELNGYLRKNPSTPPDSIFIIRSGYESQYLARGEVQPRSALFEDKSPSRMSITTKNDKEEVILVNYELAVVYFDKRTQKLNFTALEGRLDDLTLVDNKLNFVKAGDDEGALEAMIKLAWRFEKNPDNAKEKIVYQFNPLADGRGGAALDAALAFKNAVINKEKGFGIKERGDVAVGSDEEYNDLLIKMLNEGRFEFKVADLATRVPQAVLQAVLQDGPGMATDQLSQQDIDALLPIAKQVWLDAGASPVAFAGLTVNLQELPTGFAAWAQGNTITLDATGAGWGWYIDASPLDHSEFALSDAASAWRVDALEDNNPAEDRLDLLTVLIHELGHVAGLDHSDGPTDIMSQYLAPGQRRMLSSDDVAELGAAHYLQTVVGTSTNGAGSYAALIVPSQWQNVHSTLSNGNFAGDLSNCERFGRVEAAQSTVSSATGQTITLAEASTTTGQTRLAQAFTLNASNRFLTFTVTGLDLQHNSSADEAAPQDAFEVALLNANTGLPVLWSAGDGTGNGTANSAGISTSKSDALLNIQRATSALDAPLNERAASGVSHQDNPDGSRTYLVDLRGIAANTAVNLSFDLIGFGNRAATQGSQVSLRDVRLIGSPLVQDDAASLPEDGSLSINVQANDLNGQASQAAQGGSFALQVVASAQHGQVQLLADGNFQYTPDANFFGQDAFTYRYSNGSGLEDGLSEIATVSISVTPVNDAPVASDVAVTTLEDNAATINLVALDAGNTPATLQFVIQNAPQNGTLTANPDGSYSYQPAANFHGADSFTDTACRTESDLRGSYAIHA